MKSPRHAAAARPISAPVAPWDIPFVTEEDLIAEARRDAASRPFHPVQPAPTPVVQLVARTFSGRLNVSDLDYMAKALLQMLDENHALREDVRLLKARLDGMEGGGDVG
jgi:hypothetical protein